MLDMWIFFAAYGPGRYIVVGDGCGDIKVYKDGERRAWPPMLLPTVVKRKEKSRGPVSKWYSRAR